jgi:hypothetical protein
MPIFQKTAPTKHCGTTAVISQSAAGKHNRKSSWQMTGREHLDQDGIWIKMIVTNESSKLRLELHCSTDHLRSESLAKWINSEEFIQERFQTKHVLASQQQR